MPNGTFGSGTGWVLVCFGSLPGQLCSGQLRVKFGFGSRSCQPCSGRVQFGSGEVRVRVTYRFHARVRMSSVRVDFESGLLKVVYSSPGSDSV